MMTAWSIAVGYAPTKKWKLRRGNQHDSLVFPADYDRPKGSARAPKALSTQAQNYLSKGFTGILISTVC